MERKTARKKIPPLFPNHHRRRFREGRSQRRALQLFPQATSATRRQERGGGKAPSKRSQKERRNALARLLHSAVTLDESSAPGSRGSLTSRAAVEAAASRKNKGATRSRRKHTECAPSSAPYSRRRRAGVADDVVCFAPHTGLIVHEKGRDRTVVWWGSRFNGTPCRRTRWRAGSARAE